MAELSDMVDAAAKLCPKPNNKPLISRKRTMSGQAQNDMSKVASDNLPAKRVKVIGISSKNGACVWDKEKNKFVRLMQLHHKADQERHRLQHQLLIIQTPPQDQLLPPALTSRQARLIILLTRGRLPRLSHILTALTRTPQMKHCYVLPLMIMIVEQLSKMTQATQHSTQHRSLLSTDKVSSSVLVRRRLKVLQIHCHPQRCLSKGNGTLAIQWIWSMTR